MAESSSAVLKGFFTAPGKVHIRLLKHGVLENISKRFFTVQPCV